MRPTFSYRIDDELEIGLLEPRHAPALAELVVRNRAHLGRWLPWAEGIAKAEDQHPFIVRGLGQFAAGDGFQGGVWYCDRLIGAVGLHYFDAAVGKTELGYWLDRDHQGRGLMTRVVAGVCRLLFEDYGLNRVEIRCDVANERSRAVPERLGFCCEGTLRQVVANRGERRDLVVYGLLANEWAGRERT